MPPRLCRSYHACRCLDILTFRIAILRFVKCCQFDIILSNLAFEIAGVTLIGQGSAAGPKERRGNGVAIRRERGRNHTGEAYGS